MRRIQTVLSAAPIVLLAAFVAAGCGSDSGSSKSKSSSGDEPVKVRSVDEPEPDEKLDDEVGADTVKTLTDAGCVVGSFKEGEATHVKDGEDLDSDTFPPVGGTHFEDWAPFGLYDKPVEDGYVVHNLEHGGVVVWLGTKVDDDTQKAVADLLDKGEKWLVAPRRDIEGLYSAAWYKALSCSPDALTKLGPEKTADALDDWYDAVNSTGSEAEKDVPAYAGAMKEPTPKRDISEASPF